MCWLCLMYNKADPLDSDFFKWNFRPHLCTYRLNSASGWWDQWDDTALQTQNSKFEPWRVRKSMPSLCRGGSPQYWIFTSERRSNTFLWKLKARVGFKPSILNLPSRQLYYCIRATTQRSCNSFIHSFIRSFFIFFNFYLLLLLFLLLLILFIYSFILLFFKLRIYLFIY